MKYVWFWKYNSAFSIIHGTVIKQLRLNSDSARFTTTYYYRKPVFDSETIFNYIKNSTYDV